MLNDIEVFCTIVKQQNLSKAAKDLHVSPSIVTRRLARLEQRLNTRLFERTTRQLTITDSGQRYYDSVHDILLSLKTLEDDIRTSNEQVSGHLKVGLPVSISNRFVSANLHQFLKKYPALHIQIVNGNHLLNLLDNGFSCILHCGPLPNVSYYYKKIATWRKVLCAAPSYLSLFGTPNNLEELQNHNCLDHLDNTERIWNFHIKGNIRSIPINGNISVDSSMDLCQLASSGLGIAYLPTFSVHSELRTGKLIPILQECTNTEFDMFAVYPSKQYLHKKTQVFIDFMAELMAKGNME
ncbi:LysR family transcriptional regulator [Vibrio sp. S4M6]|uniref:LysR family transcriptional regulator n=1 Tax=Vibrio sinus TaxID=2946865 RepID=UPI00202A03BD|nr:LysR family transcriptional regulator [Vibrio sinus]MCL9783610.1 LysR family transcriptional regulator [Vibrio sinus]